MCTLKFMHPNLIINTMVLRAGVCREWLVWRLVPSETGTREPGSPFSWEGNRDSPYQLRDLGLHGFYNQEMYIYVVYELANLWYFTIDDSMDETRIK